MGWNLFIENAFYPDRQLYFVAVVFTVIVSIVLHELSHGWAALHQGDDTPRISGHMTVDPITHMGWFAIAAMFLVGIAWGQMPINPSRFRSKFGEAIVAFAGPSMNLMLAFLALTTYAVLIGVSDDFMMARAFGLGSNGKVIHWVGQPEELTFRHNLLYVLMIFGSTNVLLFIFNMFPIPPLDGSHILANFHEGYARWLANPASQQIMMFGFFLAFMISGHLWDFVYLGSIRYTNWIESLIR